MAAATRSAGYSRRSLTASASAVPAAVRLGREPGQQLLPLRAEQDGRIGVHRLEASAALTLAARAVSIGPGGASAFPVVDTLPLMSDGSPVPPAEMSWDVMDLLGEIEGIGVDPVRGGYSRFVFEPAELELRAWFTGRARALGLTVELDRNGNLWAYWGGRGGDTIAVGSHLDSVPGGGALDGPLGVASALSAVARLKSRGVTPPRPVAVVAFAEEEGSRFGIACLGSKLTAGSISPESARRLADAGGTTFADAASAAGVDPAGIGRDDAAAGRAGRVRRAARRAGPRAGRPRRAGRGRVRHPRARPVAAAVHR